MSSRQTFWEISQQIDATSPCGAARAVREPFPTGILKRLLATHVPIYHDYGAWLFEKFHRKSMRRRACCEKVECRLILGDWVMSHVNIWHTHTHTHTHTHIHIYMNWVMSHARKYFESCHIWMSYVAYKWVVSRMNESCHIWMHDATYGCVMSHMNVSCHVGMSLVTCECPLISVSL